MKTSEEIAKGICNNNTYLLYEPELKEIIELWQKDKEKINNLISFLKTTTEYEVVKDFKSKVDNIIKK